MIICYGKQSHVNLNLWPHILPAAWRKDRYRSTSRSSSLIRSAIACGSLIGCFRGRPFLFRGTDGWACFRLNRLIQFLIFLSNLSAFAISWLVRPCWRIWSMNCSFDWISVHFLVINTPPVIVILQQGALFAQCPFLRVQFTTKVVREVVKTAWIE